MSENEKKLKEEKTEKVKKILKKFSSDRLDAILNTNQIPFIGSTAIGKMGTKKNSKSQGSPTQRNKKTKRMNLDDVKNKFKKRRMTLSGQKK